MASISVLVPVYRVEKYLPQCIDSILRQTYQDFELLLIDDGSPDKCGEICEAYARRDGRIKVFHIKNGGLSAARNFGLAHAAGKYITFVDSDDWAEPDMLGYLWETMSKMNAQVATCGVFLNYEDRQMLQYPAREARLLSGKESLKKLFYHQAFTSYTPGKLYMRELFAPGHFLSGIENGEDLVGVSRVLLKAERVAHSTVAKYHYRQRSDGIVRGSSFQKRASVIAAVQVVRRQIEKVYPDLLPAMDYLYTEANLQMVDHAPDFQKAKPYIRNMRPYLFQVLANKDVTLRYKKKFFIACMGMPLYSGIGHMYRLICKRQDASHL